MQFLGLKLRETGKIIVFIHGSLANCTYGSIRTQSRSISLQKYENHCFGQTPRSRIHHRPSKKADVMMLKSSFMTPHHDKIIGHQSQKYKSSRWLFDF
jgi:hypothetical protein